MVLKHLHILACKLRDPNTHDGQGMGERDHPVLPGLIIQFPSRDT